VQIADIPALFDHFVGAGKQGGRSEAEYLGGVNDDPLRGRAYHQALGPHSERNGRSDHRLSPGEKRRRRRFISSDVLTLAIGRSSCFDANEQNTQLIDVDIIVEEPIHAQLTVPITLVNGSQS